MSVTAVYGPQSVRQTSPSYEGLIEPYRPVSTDLPWAVICDIDGTLALHRDRGPFDYERCVEDELNQSVAYALRLFYGDNRIILFSGRPGEDDIRKDTEYWLHLYRVPYDQLEMRPCGDYREDFRVKYEMFNRYVRDQYQVRVVLDDRKQVVRMWRGLELPCWQVNDGDF